MPRYERDCRACGHSFETVCRVAEMAKIQCPECGSKDLDVAASQFRSVSTHGKEVHGTRKRMWDIVLNPKEVPEVRREFAGVPANITDDGKVYIESKEDRAKWHKREAEIHERAQEAHAKNDEREKRGDPIKPVVKPRKKRNRIFRQA